MVDEVGCANLLSQLHHLRHQEYLPTNQLDRQLLERQTFWKYELELWTHSVS